MSPRIDSAPPEASPALRDRALALADPLRRLLERDAARGVVLIIAAALAMLWANSPWGDTYQAFWHGAILLQAGDLRMTTTLAHVVNDVLMVGFFFVIGLEIRSELHHGELSDRQRAMVPLFAAIGGALVPAAMYLAINARGGQIEGWGVPIATDIAFALGILLLLGRRVPPELRALLLGLAVIDDVAAVLVIAVFYKSGGSPVWLALSAGGIAVIILLQRIGVRRAVIYIPAGALFWYGTVRAGIHPTIAGVVVGIFTPPRAWFGPGGFIIETRRRLEQLEARYQERSQGSLDEPLDAIARALREARSPVDRLLGMLEPLVGYGVMPVFALANAGVEVSGVALGDHAPVAFGIAAGLLVGKPLGVLCAAWLSVRLGIGRLPENVGWRGMALVGVVAGVGFTMSLFITQLAFGGGGPGDVARLTVLVASVIAGTAAYLLGRTLDAGRA